MAKYVFLVKYEEVWSDDVEDFSDSMRVAVDAYDAQLAIKKAQEIASKSLIGKESDFLLDDGKTYAKCIGIRLTGVEFVTDYDE